MANEEFDSAKGPKNDFILSTRRTTLQRFGIGAVAIAEMAGLFVLGVNLWFILPVAGITGGVIYWANHVANAARRQQEITQFDKTPSARRGK